VVQKGKMDSFVIGDVRAERACLLVVGSNLDP
jgi:hypothetical protein